MTDAPPVSEYHEIGYDCKWCGVHGVAIMHKECPLDWSEALYVMLTCNRCADKMLVKRETLDALRGVLYRLETGTELTRTGVRPLTTDERMDLERTKAIYQRATPFDILRTAVIGFDSAGDTDELNHLRFIQDL